MSFYSELRDETVGPLLAEFGRATTLRRPSPGAFDTTTRLRGADGAPTDYPGFALEHPYKVEEIDGSLVRREDRRFLFIGSDAASCPAPLPGSDRLVVDGVEREIINSAPLQPGGVALYYELQVR